MALVIKGEMPTCCGLCCECLGGGSDAYYCNRAKRQISEVVPPYDKRMEWCPILGEIPDNHGRLKDGDVIRKSLSTDCPCRGCEKFRDEGACMNCQWDRFAKLIDNAPTVLEANNELEQ